MRSLRSLSCALLAVLYLQETSCFSCPNGYEEAPLDFDENSDYSFTSPTSSSIFDMLDGSGTEFIAINTGNVKVIIKGAQSGTVFNTSRLEMRTACVEKIKLELTIPDAPNDVQEEVISDPCKEWTTTRFEDLGDLKKIKVTFKFEDDGCDCDYVMVKKMFMEACIED